MSEKERQEMIESNMNLVHKVVSDMHFDERFRQDITSEGMLTLIKCVDNYDKTRGVAFSSYAYRAIKNRILKFIAKENKHTYEQEIEIISPISFEDQVVDELLLKRIMGELDAQERYLLRLRFVEGYTIKQISDITNTSYKKVYYTICDIKEKAKKIGQPTEVS